MNKTAIKNFSIWARKKLIADAAYRAGLMGITKDGIAKALPQSTGTTEFYDIGTKEPYALTGDAVMQRRRLVDTIRRKERDTDYATAYKYVLEEVAYTWFNRLIAIRFMEVNDYLPSHVRVLSSESGKLEPDLVTKPFDADLEFSTEEAERIFRLQQDNEVDALFQLLFIKQCNALHKILPGLFEMTQDVTELLFRASVVDPEGVVYHLVHDIPEEDFDVSRGGQVEIIGWLYQYYNTEPKEDTYALLKDNIKVSKERIPAATQTFTPDWIVRYMVENSLGRLWIEGHPADADKFLPVRNDIGNITVEKDKWNYYLEEAEQEPDVLVQLAEIHKAYSALKPEDIRVIDPCCGSGHILVYLFDVLVQIYLSSGYTARDAAQRIVQLNLYGLDIDPRAVQLSYFAVMMKARQYDRRFFNRNIQPMVYSPDGYPEGMEYGSLLKVEDLEQAPDFDNWTLHDGDYLTALNRWHFRYVLHQKYHVVVTNPPYLGINNTSDRMNTFAKREYPVSKLDLSTICMEKALSMCNELGFMAMINIPVWMSKSSFEQFRYMLINQHTFVNMLHNGRGIFGSDFGTTTFVIRKAHLEKYAAVFHQLFDEMGAVDSVEQKERWFFERKGRYVAEQRRFKKIASYPIAYSTSSRLLQILDEEKPLGDFSFPRKGLTTGDNDTFVRLWYEVDAEKFSMVSGGAKWFPMTKGGDFRRWYGNNEYIINWENDGSALRNFKDGSGKLRSVLRNEQYYFRECISWNDTTATGKIAFRYQPTGYISNASGPCVFIDKELKYLFGLLNSVVSQKMLEILAPNMKFEVGQMALVPIIMQPSQEVTFLVEEMVQIAKEDWDAFENSWDYQQHPMVKWSKGLWDATAIGATMHFFYGGHPKVSCPVELCYMLWQGECNERFKKLKANEEELNRIFIDIYGLQEELTPEVEDKDVTVRRADLGRDIRSLVSYAVGCMFGRYSLNKEGLAYAGGDWDASQYTLFSPDADNVIPITDEGYLEDDIVARFVDFIRTIYGKDSLEENLDFIAGALGNKGSTSREVIRNYFLNDFFNDHCQTYSVTGSGKRPIYWLFDSGKQNGFKALIYLHRYTPETVGTLRVDYLHRLQRVYESEIDRMQDMIDNSSNSREIAAATKRKEKLIKQLKECRDYDEKLAHLALARISLDLDDGVKVNYRKLQTAPDGKFYEVLAQSKNIMAKEK